MSRTLVSALVYVLANGVGLLVASLVLGDSFTFTFKGFFVATLLLSVVEAVAGPAITKAAEDNVPALKGGIALIITFVGLLVTNFLVGGMHIAGISTWLIATLLVWIGALIAQIVLPRIPVKKAVQKARGKQPGKEG
ncbi:phage holin family protein [Tropicimonas sp.]|uniref:phage holin family protein n=1 Tax=Tropicimonas sp. TaxID=2067044 RepID=UPI003A86ADB7